MSETSMIVKENLQRSIQIIHNVDIFYRRAYAHFHDNYEITFVLTPNVKFTIDNREYHTTQGSLLIINDNEIHYNFVPDNLLYDRYVLYIPQDFLIEVPQLRQELLKLFVDRPENFENCLDLTPVQVAKMTRLMEQLHEYAQQEIYARNWRMQLKTAEVLLFCNEILLDYRKLPAFHNERAYAIAGYIQAHYQENLTLDTLCQQFFISKSHLIAIFKTNLGMTPNEYLVTVRIMRARELLKKGLQVVKVCELIGYNDESHFIRTFKKIIGATPKQYAKLFGEHYTAE